MNYPAASRRGIKRHCEQNDLRGGESNPEGLTNVKSLIGDLNEWTSVLGDEFILRVPTEQ